MKFKALTALTVLLVSGVAEAGSAYDFDYKDKNHMRGAYTMCATTGFTQGDCPKVLEKCWKPPMIYKKKHKIKTYCTGTPSFSTSQEDIDMAHDEALRYDPAMHQ